MQTSELPHGPAPAPVPLPHFPDPLHAAVWRNWELVDPARLAEVLRTTPAQLAAVAESMGLPPSPAVAPEHLRRNYIGLIRRNWHLLPYEQLLALLGWDAAQMAYTLREDDFLWVKLGFLKPECAPVHYAAPSAAAQRRAAAIRRVVQAEFGDALATPGEPPFAFLREFAAPPAAPLPVAPREGLRLLYSYAALYGDALMAPELDPYPDGYLAQLAALGVNGIWLHTVLHKLARWRLAPELADGYEVRLANLRQLVARAARFGIGVYLYINEPRALPLAFFERYPELRGVTDEGYAALCTSVPAVQDFLVESLAAVFAAVPELAGVFTISMSENLTNCHSRWHGDECPRCRERSPAAVVAEVNQRIAEGVWQSQPQARVIVWDWGWGNDWAAEAIARLPRGVWLMSVSEWDLPIERGGVATTVGEYSLSAVGPGPRAQRHWAAARRHGLHTVARMQVSTSWELGAVPYIPALELVAEHLHNLAGMATDGLMASWTCGGYPSPNLALAAHYRGGAAPPPLQALDAVARQRFGPQAAPHVVQAWRQFSAAFRAFPYHGRVVYLGPQHAGPANLLYDRPTGYAATMVGFPYDDVDGWRAVYPPEVFESQFAQLAAGWRAGLAALQAAYDAAPSAALAGEMRVAEAVYLHYQSVANQVAFVRARQSDAPRRAALLRAEIGLARRLFALVNADSRLGFEASNHYFYQRLDLVEKVVNCHHLLETGAP